MARTCTWDGGGSTNNASEAANWDTDVAPVNGDSLSFGASSNKACTFNINNLTLVNITFAAAYTATFTFTAGNTITLTGNLVMVSQTVIVFGSGSTWNIAGSIDPNITATSEACNYGGATVNLSGVAKTWGVVSSNSIVPVPGVINLLAGASYTQDNGNIGGVDFHNYGNINASAELNILRGGTQQTRIYNHSTGSFTGTGAIVFTLASQWVQQDGVVSISMGIIDFIGAPSTMALVPATYASPTFTIYRQGGGAQTFAFTNGTYNLTGANGVVMFDDGFSGSQLAIDNSANATINVSGTSFDLTSPLGGLLLWTPGCGTSEIAFSNANCTLKSNGLTLDKIHVLSGGKVTLGGDLIANGLNVTGNFDGATHSVTLRDDWQYSGTSGNFTAAGFAGATWTVNGCVRLLGTTGNHLNLNPNSGWTLALTGGPLYTYRVDYATIKNLTVTGGTLYAVNCTDSGGNTGVTFGSSPPTSNAILASFAITTGAHNVQVVQASSVLTFMVDSAAFGSSVSFSHALAPVWGFVSYYNGTYTNNVSIDNFGVSNPLVVPIAPASFAASDTGLLTWLVSPGATGYTIDRGTDGVTYGTNLVNNSGIASYQDNISGFGGTTKYYRIKATNSIGDSSYSFVTKTYPVALYVSDNCTDTDGTVIASHVVAPVNVPGGSWANFVNTCEIRGNKIGRIGTTALNAYFGCFKEGGQAAGTLTVDYANLGTQGDPYAGIIFRYSDSSNYWILRQTAGTTLNICKVVAGAEGAGSANYTVAALLSATHSLGIVTSGNSISSYLDGVLLGTITDSFNATATKIGVRGYYGTTNGTDYRQTFDNVVYGP